MKLSTFGLILASVMLSAVAQLMMKAGTRTLGVLPLDPSQALVVALRVGSQPYILGGLTVYFVSAAMWILTLSRVDVSIAYPMASMGYVVVAVAAWALLGEPITPGRVAGIALILAGVIALARG